MKWLIERAETTWRTISTELSSTEFYIQNVIISFAVIVGWMLGTYILQPVKLLREEPHTGAPEDLRWMLHRAYPARTRWAEDPRHGGRLACLFRSSDDPRHHGNKAGAWRTNRHWYPHFDLIPSPQLFKPPFVQLT